MNERRAEHESISPVPWLNYQRDPYGISGVIMSDTSHRHLMHCGLQLKTGDILCSLHEEGSHILMKEIEDLDLLRSSRDIEHMVKTE